MKELAKILPYQMFVYRASLFACGHSVVIPCLTRGGFFSRSPGPRPFLLLLLQQRKVDHLHHLEAHSGDVSDGVILAIETGHQHFLVLLDVVEATVPENERRDLLGTTSGQCDDFP